MSSFTLKQDGNIDVGRLEKDLRNALDFDIKYKQADNMKKRACKISADYDEFKAFVACAHLKTVSRDEISSLGTAKKGWQKASIGDKASSALILSDELKAVRQPEISSVMKGRLFKKPKNPMELERDLRKLSSDLEKNRYLNRVGMKRIMKLLQVDGNAELLESIILLLLIEESTILRKPKAQQTLVGQGSENKLDDPEVMPKKDDEEVSEKNNKPFSEDGIMEWLDAFTTLDRFDLMVRFFSKALILQIVQTLEKSDKSIFRDSALRYEPNS